MLDLLEKLFTYLLEERKVDAIPTRLELDKYTYKLLSEEWNALERDQKLLHECKGMDGFNLNGHKLRIGVLIHSNIKLQIEFSGHRSQHL